MEMKTALKIKVLAKRAKRARGWLTIKINIYIQNCIARFRYGLVQAEVQNVQKVAKNVQNAARKRARNGKMPL